MYIALRAMQVQGEDGNTRHVKPGDPVPEAAGWKTLRAYINRGWICQEGQPLNDAAAARMTRAIRDRDKALSEASDKIGQLSRELEGVRGMKAVAEASPAAAMDDTAPSDTTQVHDGGGDLAESEATPANFADAPSAPPSEDPELTRKELQKMGKDSLVTLADSMGVDPGQSKNKLVEAIFAAQ